MLESAPRDDRSGEIYTAPEENQLEDAIRRFEKVEARIVPSDLQAHAAHFSEAEFAARMSEVLGRFTSHPSRSGPPGPFAAEASNSISRTDSHQKQIHFAALRVREAAAARDLPQARDPGSNAQHLFRIASVVFLQLTLC